MKKVTIFGGSQVKRQGAFCIENLKAFLSQCTTDPSKVHFLRDNEMFTVGKRTFKWKYTSTNDELSDDEDDRSEDEADVYDFAEPNDDDSIQPFTSSEVNHAKASTNTGKGKRQLGCSTKIQRLSAEQSELLRGLFKTNVHLRRELKREECEKVKKKYPILDTLPWKKIKNTVHNWITIEKRKIRH